MEPYRFGKEYGYYFNSHVKSMEDLKMVNAKWDRYF